MSFHDLLRLVHCIDANTEGRHLLVMLLLLNDSVEIAQTVILFAVDWHQVCPDIFLELFKLPGNNELFELMIHCHLQGWLAGQFNLMLR